MSIYFGPDNYSNRRQLPKIYVRALLFCTAKRGRVVESIFVEIINGERRQNFSIWVYGEHGKFVRGSGLFVGEAGASFDHHFLTPPDDNDYLFRSGEYKLNIYIKLLGSNKQYLAFSEIFALSPEMAAAMDSRKVGIYFDWGPDSQKYWPHVDEGPSPTPDADDFVKALASLASQAKATAPP